MEIEPGRSVERSRLFLAREPPAGLLPLAGAGKADIDHGKWSSRRGDPHAYPPDWRQVPVSRHIVRAAPRTAILSRRPPQLAWWQITVDCGTLSAVPRGTAEARSLRRRESVREGEAAHRLDGGARSPDGPIDQAGRQQRSTTVRVTGAGGPSRATAAGGLRCRLLPPRSPAPGTGSAAGDRAR